mmetsp:Transcript_3942/g.4074  ORF Transcript_3942/g.4074 Transcript_3942/m.4074 type:complete len:82 (+) Transcript_3942:3-248(+)
MDTEKEMKIEEEQVPPNKDMSERDPNEDDRGDDYSNDVIGKDKNENDTEECCNHKEGRGDIKINDLVQRLNQYENIRYWTI